MMNRRTLLLLFAILVTSTGVACPGGGGGGGPSNNAQICVCPGWQMRLLQQCPKFPHSGGFFIEIGCALNETNVRRPDGSTACGINIESSNSAVLAVRPAYVEIDGGTTQRKEFDTIGNLPAAGVSDTVEIFSNYNNQRYVWTTIRVSNSCP